MEAALDCRIGGITKQNPFFKSERKRTSLERGSFENVYNKRLPAAAEAQRWAPLEGL